MSSYVTRNIRNVGLIGHGGEGKTTLTEAMLFNAKVIDRFGRVDDGTTTTDFDPEEIKRKISINAALAPFEWNGHKINIIDVPGYFDFVGEMIEALRVVDAAVIVVGAVSGVMVGTEKAWDYCNEYNLPVMIFVNQMDRENVHYERILQQLEDKYGTRITPIQIPIMKGGKFAGVVDVVKMKAWEFADKGVKETSIPDDISDALESIRTRLVEAAAETSEELMEKYFEGEELTEEEIQAAICKGVAAGDIVPVLFGSALTNAGVDILMDSIVKYMPAPDERPEVSVTNIKTGQVEKRKVDASQPFSALVFKTIVDPFVGKLSLFKVMSGELVNGMNLYNANKEKGEKSGNLYILRGKRQIAVDKLTAGDIGALAKLQVTSTGDTLCDPAYPIMYEGLKFPEPCLSMAVNAEKQGEEEKVFTGLNRLTEEDPTFKIEQNAETGETIISGTGEVHLDVIASRLKNKFGVNAIFKEPKVPYRETIRKPIKAEGKHKKQTGGHGQYGHVFIEFEPLPNPDEQRFEFVDKIVGGVVPRQYIPAVEKGLVEAMQKGVLAGYPMVGIRATLYDGSFHPVDSSEMSFKIAAYLAYKKLDQANPVLLEPIMHAEVVIPDEYMGDIIGDLNRRRGRILGMTPLGNGLQKVDAEVPLAEMFRYATDLRSMTQARGSFKLTFVRYEEVPGNISAKIVEQAKREAQEE